MQNPNGLRVLFLLSPAAFLLLPISTLIFILERISQSLLNTQLNRNYRSGYRQITLNGPANSSSNAGEVPTTITLSIDVGPTLAILGVCVFAFVVGVLACCGIWELRRVEGSPGMQRFWAWTSYVANVITVGLSVGVLAWASAVQAGEGWNGYDDVGDPDQRFTRETWVCQIDKFYPREDWAGPVCGLSVCTLRFSRLSNDTNTKQKATRFMLIPLAISSILVMVSTWILVRDRGGVKWLFGGKGRYAGFASVYEMNPHAPAPPYQPGPQFYPVPQQYAPQMPQQYAPQQYPQQQYQGYPSTQFQPAPQGLKDPAAGERAVFR
jgi:hypothetical protein